MHEKNYQTRKRFSNWLWNLRARNIIHILYYIIYMERVERPDRIPNSRVVHPLERWIALYRFRFVLSNRSFQRKRMKTTLSARISDKVASAKFLLALDDITCTRVCVMCTCMSTFFLEISQFTHSHPDTLTHLYIYF